MSLPSHSLSSTSFPLPFSPLLTHFFSFPVLFSPFLPSLSKSVTPGNLSDCHAMSQAQPWLQSWAFKIINGDKNLHYLFFHSSQPSPRLSLSCWAGDKFQLCVVVRFLIQLRWMPGDQVSSNQCSMWTSVAQQREITKKRILPVLCNLLITSYNSLCTTTCTITYN